MLLFSTVARLVALEQFTSRGNGHPYGVLFGAADQNLVRDLLLAAVNQYPGNHTSPEPLGGALGKERGRFHLEIEGSKPLPLLE